MVMQRSDRPRIRFQSKALCSSCLSCATVCALRSADSVTPDSARIRIEFDPFAGTHTARVCRHCDQPLCLDACDKGAIFKDPETEIVTIDQELCNGCKLCVDACPFGALFWSSSSQQVIKCDLCGGEPRCVDACNFGVLTYE
jgi:Fe-S-cluster-containing dehydrogenase component